MKNKRKGRHHKHSESGHQNPFGTKRGPSELQQKFSEDGTLILTVAEQAITSDTPRKGGGITATNARHLDSLLSVAVLNLRKKKSQLSKSIIRRVGFVVNIIKKKYDGWIPAEFPNPQNLWRSEEERFLSVFSFVSDMDLEGEVALMQHWLQTGTIRHNMLRQRDRERANLLKHLSDQSFHTNLSLQQSGIAVIHFFQLQDHIRVKDAVVDHLIHIGFHLSPLVVAYLYTIKSGSEKMYMKIFVCGYEERVFTSASETFEALKRIDNSRTGTWSIDPYGILSPCFAGITSPIFTISGEEASDMRNRITQITETHFKKPE